MGLISIVWINNEYKIMFFKVFELIFIYITAYNTSTVIDNILDFNLCFFLIKGLLGVSAGAHKSIDISDIPSIM